MSADFLLTSLVVVLLPGTGVIYTLAIGLGLGFRASLAAALGCTIGIIPAALASILGLAAILHTSAMAFQLIKYLGVLYLFYMAWQILRDSKMMDVSAERKPMSLFKTVLTGITLNVLNPKLSFFFMAFLPQFIVPGNGSVNSQLLIMAGVFMALTLAVFVLYGMFASLARTYVTSRPKVMLWFKRSFAATFGLLGLKLAFSER